MLPGTTPSDSRLQKEKDERRKIIIALLFLLLSFSCIFCSSQSALWLINRDRIEASMRSSLSADYGFDPALGLAPLSGDIAAEAEHDEAALVARQTPIAVGLGVVVLPNPIPTPQPQPTVIALLPTPTLTPTASAPPAPAPATPTPVAPTATLVPPTSAPPTSTSAPPIVPPPTIPPTIPPPTLPPPTLPPTVPPATVPPTSLPPTDTATPVATATPIDTATATPTPTDTPTPIPTDTPTATPVPPSVQFSTNSYTVNEAAGAASIEVTLSGASSVTITVDYATSDLTASAGSDYNTTTGQLTFPPGSTSQTFSVTIIDETPALDEPDETIRLALSNPNGATPGTPFNATLTIIDDDTPGTCPGLYPSGEPNIGPPNGNSARIACDVGMIMDLGTPITVGHPGFDLVYYEVQGLAGPNPPPPPYYIYMDLIQIQIGQTPGGPWFTVFEWGDGIDDTNTNIGGIYPDTGPASDNTYILSQDLVGPGDPLNTGIQIDMDNLPGALPAVPAGSYQYIRLFSPLSGANDGPEVDAIEVLP